MEMDTWSYYRIRIAEIVLFLIGVILLMGQISCKKAVEVNPPVTGLVSATVYNSNATASAAVSGIYISMMAGGGAIGGGPSGISALLGLSSDELWPYPNSAALLSQIYTNSLTSNNVPFWNQLYNYIYQANAAIKGLDNSTGVTASMKKQLIGEAKFTRALCHYYLVNIFGDVPLIISTDYRLNALATRTPRAQIYQQILTDLKDAQNLLSDNYLTPTGSTTPERVRPNKGAVTALLARVYLYTGDWVNAEAQASAIISNSTQYTLRTDLNEVFIKNNTESIWQLQVVVVTGFNTWDGLVFLLGASGGPNTSVNPFILANPLLNSFEPGDLRKSNWVNNMTLGGQTYYFPYKYKVRAGTSISEYPVIMRLAEQYLIRAEARAQQNNVAGAQSDLNTIRNRAGLPNTIAIDKASLLSAIEHERQVELFTEYGHRWLDLKRTNRIDPVMSMISPQKGSVWNTNWQWYPIPFTELTADPNLTQNSGY